MGAYVFLCIYLCHWTFSVMVEELTAKCSRQNSKLKDMWPTCLKSQRECSVLFHKIMYPLPSTFYQGFWGKVHCLNKQASWRVYKLAVSIIMELEFHGCWAKTGSSRRTSFRDKKQDRYQIWCLSFSLWVVQPIVYRWSREHLSY